MKNINIIISVVVVLIIAGTVAAIPMIKNEEGQNMFSGFTTTPTTQESGDTGDSAASTGIGSSGSSGGSSGRFSGGSNGGSTINAAISSKVVSDAKTHIGEPGVSPGKPYKKGDSIYVTLIDSNGKSVDSLQYDANGNFIGRG